MPRMAIIEFANSADSDEAAYHEPPDQALHCLPSSLKILNMIQLNRKTFFENLQM